MGAGRSPAQQSGRLPGSGRVQDGGWIGFREKGGKGRHRVFALAGEPQQLNFQDRGDGRIPTYQAKQLIAMIDKYLGDHDRRE
jgi:hypothetical protein